jgi:uncharacterized protein DUF4390
LALLLSLFLSTAAFADARIENLTASAAGSLVSVRMQLAEAFRDGKLQQTLQSGLPTTLTYEIEIFRDRPNWFDERVGRAQIEVISTFNSITREYLLNYRRDRRLVRSELFTDLPMLERAMTRIEEPNLFDIGDRRPYKLKVRAKANLMRGYLLYVIPREVATRWREARVMGAITR